MSTKTLFIETSQFKFPPNLPADAAKADGALGSHALALTIKSTEPSLTQVCAPKALRDEKPILAVLDAVTTRKSIVYLDTPEDYAGFQDVLQVFLSDARTIGVKSFLEKGSTVYSETFFNTKDMGQRLDACFALAKASLPRPAALGAWETVQSFLFLGLEHLPELGEGGTGEKVDVQVGADANGYAVSVRFDLPEAGIAGVRDRPVLQLARAAADFFEVRYLSSAKKMELTALFRKKARPKSSVEIQASVAVETLEKQENATDYAYKGFKDIAPDRTPEKRVIKASGFRKKFSDNPAMGAEAPAPATAPAAAPAPEPETKSAPETKVVVSGNATIDNKKANALNQGLKDRTHALFESKIQGLEATIKQRDEQIVKLSKEIEAIKDPSKRGVITGIKDVQVDGLKDNTKRLEKELAEAQAREKEMMVLVDKAVQIKDDTMKKYKEIALKLSQVQDGNNSKVVTLERQLDESKRQNKELSKRITQLMEQGRKAG